MIRKATVIVILLIFACIGVYAGGSKPPEKILIIGDSLTGWNGGLDRHLEELASSASPPMNIDAYQFYKGSTSLKSFWQNTTLHELIDEGGYDVIVIQDDVRLIDLATFHEYTRKFVVKSKEVKAKPVLFMGWNYMTKKRFEWATMDVIIQANDDIANELNISIIPVGLAIENTKKERPNLTLIMHDNIHTTIHGTYLSACVSYATIFGKNPIGLSYIPVGYTEDEITEEEAAFLQHIAWETVQEHQSQ